MNSLLKLVQDYGMLNIIIIKNMSESKTVDSKIFLFSFLIFIFFSFIFYFGNLELRLGRQDHAVTYQSHQMT